MDSGYLLTQQLFTGCLNVSTRHYKWSDILDFFKTNRNIRAYNENNDKGKMKCGCRQHREVHDHLVSPFYVAIKKTEGLAQLGW